MVAGFDISPEHLQSVSLVAAAPVAARSVDAAAVHFTVVTESRMKFTLVDIYAVVSPLVKPDAENEYVSFYSLLQKCYKVDA